MGKAGHDKKSRVDLESDFRDVQLGRYFMLTAKKDFSTSEEAEIINRLISTAYVKYIEPVRKKLSVMNSKERTIYFSNINIEFPLYPGRENELEEIEVDADDVEFDIEEDEDLAELLDQLEDDDLEHLDELDDEDIFDGIPEEDREDVVMLMIAFPALKEAGFPLDIFLAGTKHPDLSEKQRQQIDWGLQLAYKVAEIEQTRNTTKRKRLFNDLRTFAGAFLPEKKIDNVLKEMKKTYRKGRG
jgi:hypothetical protein